MADSRSLSFGVQFDAGTDSLDTLNSKQQTAQQEAENTAESLDQIGTSLTDIGTRATSEFSKVGSASVKMGTSVRGAMLDSIKSGDSLGKTLRTGIGSTVTNLKDKFKGFGSAAQSVAKDIGNAFLHPAQTIKATLGKALNNIQGDTSKVGTEADGAGKRLGNMGKKGKDAGHGLVNILKKVAVALGALAIAGSIATGIKDFSASAITAAASAEETASKFSTVFKDAAAGTESWAESFSSAAHRSKNEVKGFLADSGAIFSGIGMASKDAADMSQMMTSLSYDLASFNNISDADAFAKLRSGLMGETEGLKSMGVVLNETALKQSMMSMGMKGNFNDLSEAEKVQVRFNAVLAQTADAQGDVTRTSGSYTNSLKGIKGVWADFLADAGTRFTPALTGMFNSILDAWPTIEPMLMGLVDLLGEGLSTAVPILLELGQQLLPLLCDSVSLVMQVAQPLIPVIGQFATVLLPPMITILSMLCSSLLPPITQVLMVLCNDVLLPLMPTISMLAMTLLPPLVQLIGVIGPLLQAASPILQFVGSVLVVIAKVIGTIIGWVTNGIGKVADFFSGLFGGAKQAAGGMDQLVESTEKVGASVPDISMPEISIPDTNAYTSKVQSAMDTTPIMAAESWNAVKDTATSGLSEIGTATEDTYGTMAEKAETAWNRMRKAAQSTVAATLTELQRLKSFIDGAGSTVAITISGAAGNVQTIPSHANGTDNFKGGLTRINEKGGEMAILPSGSKIIPADKTEKLINASKHSKKSVFAPQINITLSGNASQQDKTDLEERIKRIVRKLYEQMQDEDCDIEALETALT